MYPTCTVISAFCYFRCPLYYNLPNECTLVRSPSKCCQQPVCNFNQNIQTFQSNSMGRTPAGLRKFLLPLNKKLTRDLYYGEN